VAGVPMSCEHEPNTTPNAQGACVKCGLRIPESWVPLIEVWPRNVELERMLTEKAASAAGYHGPNGEGDDAGMTSWSEHRTLPGGVRARTDEGFVREVREEYADARNYLVWGVERYYDRYLAGDPLACDKVARNMNSLKFLMGAWHALTV
jgi:hypothetical protein